MNMKLSLNDVARFEAKVSKYGPKPKKYVLKRFPELEGSRCWIWTAGRTVYGYGTFGVPIAKKRKWKIFAAHVVAYWIYVGSLKKCCLHKCDKRFCVNPLHLFDGSRRTNNKDRHTKGRSKGGATLGEKHPGSKLTEKEVLTIRKLYSSGKFSFAKLGGRFNVTAHQIYLIVHRKNWTHV